MKELEKQARRLIALALEEDLGSGDVTSEYLIPEHSCSTAILIAKKPCVVAGLFLVPLVFESLGKVIVTNHTSDSRKVYGASKLVTIEGPSRALMAGERLCLNLLGRLCGIATHTRRFVVRTKKAKVDILDTRKTTPGMRLLEKYAVACGGGKNHRMGLYDAILIKENHIAAAGGIVKALQRARSHHRPGLPIQVEVRNAEELVLALENGADSILLDNMTPEQVKKMTRLVNKRVPLEVSGGVCLANVALYAATGVDRISIGALTHSAPNADLSLLVQTSGDSSICP